MSNPLPDAVSLGEVFGMLTAENGERFPPFRWQTRLLDELLQGDIPEDQQEGRQ